MLVNLPSDLRRQSINSDVMGRYYTSSAISSALIGAMSVRSPKLIVELGAGRGALVNAAFRKWSNADFITVDADRTAIASLIGVTEQTSHRHYVHDVLDTDLASSIGLSSESADVGLCNPPFVRPRWRAGFGHILEDAGLSGALRSVHDAGADLLFIAQNLRLLKAKGKLGLILPDGLITGEKYQGVRQALLRQHSIEQVVQLPRRIFSNTDAQTYLLVLSKRGGETQEVVLRNMSGIAGPPESIRVPAESARIRLDYAFHAQASCKVSCSKARVVKIGDITSRLFRGTIASNQVKDLSYPVFHLGDFPPETHKGDRTQISNWFYKSKQFLNALPNSPRYAEEGDILIARIGRNLHLKVCIVAREACVISDCIFVLRTEKKYRKQLLRFLMSEEGRRSLTAASHGVGAKYLTKGDITSMSAVLE